MFKDVRTEKKGQMALDTGSSALVLKVRMKNVGLRQGFLVEKEKGLNFDTLREPALQITSEERKD